MRYNEKAVIKKLKTHIKKRYKTQAEAGRVWGKHRQYVHLMLQRPSLIPDEVLKEIGLKRVVEVYYEERK